MTILEQKVQEYLTIKLGRVPTSAEIQAGIKNPLVLSKIHNTLNVIGSEISITTSDDIQENLDQLFINGGGTLKLNPGTYILTDHLYIPSGVSLIGASRDNCIIDCNINYSVKMSGENEYTDGTVTINPLDTEVVGSGTNWAEYMIGSKIFLDNLSYDISDVIDSTHIVISVPYYGSVISGSSYVIVDVNVASKISKVVITNSSSNGLEIKYSQEPVIDNINIYGCDIGLYLKNVDGPLISLWSYENNKNAYFEYVAAFEIRFSSFTSSLVSDGIEFVGCSESTFFDSGISGNITNGISMTDCNNIAFISVSVNSNGANGVEFISGNMDNQFSNGIVQDNILDGFKFTADADRNIIASFLIINNNSYGININDSSCSKNQIISPAFENNTLGDISDSGTDTVILPQAPQAITYKSGTATYDLSTASGTQTIAHGLGKTPSKVDIIGVYNTTTIYSRSDGGFTSSGNRCVYSLDVDGSTTTNLGNSTSYAINLGTTASAYATGVITVDSTNITITWTKTGSPTGTAYLLWQVE